MASNQTTNYGLNQWEATDQVLRTDFNADNQKIDAALKGLAEKDTALEGTLASQAASIAAKGNCQIYYSTYVGNGSSSRTHTFSKQPLLVFIAGPDIRITAVSPCTETPSANSTQNVKLNTSWSGNRLTISYTGSYAGGDQKVLNKSGTTYYIVALMSA